MRTNKIMFGFHTDVRQEQRQQRAIDKDDFVFGVVDNVGQLVREEPNVERVGHARKAWDAKEELQVVRAEKLGQWRTEYNCDYFSFNHRTCSTRMYPHDRRWKH